MHSLFTAPLHLFSLRPHKAPVHPQPCQTQIVITPTYLATIHLFRRKRLQLLQAGTAFVPLSKKPSGMLKSLSSTQRRLHLSLLLVLLLLLLLQDGVILLAGHPLVFLLMYSSSSTPTLSSYPTHLAPFSPLHFFFLSCILLTSSPFSLDIQQPGYPSTHSPMTYNYASSSPVAETGHVKWYGQDTTATTAAHHKPQGEGVKMIPLMPTTPDPKQQFYCKELDGSFSLRTVDDIGKNAGPGFWQYGSSGWPFFTRTK